VHIHFDITPKTDTFTTEIIITIRTTPTTTIVIMSRNSEVVHFSMVTHHHQLLRQQHMTGRMAWELINSTSPTIRMTLLDPDQPTTDVDLRVRTHSDGMERGGARCPVGVRTDFWRSRISPHSSSIRRLSPHTSGMLRLCKLL